MWGAIAGAAASALGGMLSAKGQSDANSATQAMSREQMQWQERMSNTAHQRETKDLQKAGLNRILSGTGGQGASTPSGSTSEFKNVLEPLVSSAMSALKTISEAQLTSAQKDKTVVDQTVSSANEANVRQDTRNKQIGAFKTAAEVKNISANTTSAHATARNIDEDTRLKQSTQRLQMADMASKNEFTSLLQKQGVTEAARARLTSLNGDQAVQLLKTMNVEGEISDSAFGQAMMYIKRAADSLPTIKVKNLGKGGAR